MLTIRDKFGLPVSQSHNLRGIRRAASKDSVVKVDICKVYDSEGQLSILFENGNSFQCNFASFAVLAGTVRRWKNLWGSILSINGMECGNVGPKHMLLENIEKQFVNGFHGVIIVHPGYMGFRTTLGISGTEPGNDVEKLTKHLKDKYLCNTVEVLR